MLIDVNFLNILINIVDKHCSLSIIKILKKKVNCSVVLLILYMKTLVADNIEKLRSD